jgi:hypothetical protein
MLFIQGGGRVRRAVFSEKFLYSKLISDPFLAVVNYQFLNQESKFVFSTENKAPVKDSIGGNSGTHVVTIIGYENESFILADTDPLHGGIREVSSDLLIGAMYLAQTDYDCLAITIK